MPDKRPHILFLHAHDMGRENGCYREELPTPNMRSIARQGTLFQNAHCAAPTCSPSRAALLTGRTAHQAGMLGLAHRGFDLGDYRQHMAAHFRAHGYQTVLSGVQHEFSHEREQELYDRVMARPDPPSARSDKLAAEAAARFIRSNPSHPWFLWLGFFLPHRPFLKAPQGASLRPCPEPLPDLAELRREVADFDASVGHTDRAIGTVLQALREAGQEEDTLIVLTTDHGPPFPGMKCTLSGHGTGVTLAIKPPGPGRSGDSRALVSHLDVFPTLCEFAGLPQPDWLIGHSLKPHMENRDPEPRQSAFAEVNVHACLDPMRSVRTSSFNYIHLFGADLRQPAANIDPGESKSWWIRRGLLQDERDRDQLYDLRNDPGERRNLANDPAYATVLTEMKARLLDWMKSTEDPLLQGSLFLPPDAPIRSFKALDAQSGPLVEHGGAFHDLIPLNN